MQYLEGHIGSMRRRLCSVMSECTVSEGLHLQKEDRVGGVRRKSALSRRAEEHAKSCHFLINMSGPKIFQNGAQTPEHPKIHKHLIHEHL